MSAVCPLCPHHCAVREGQAGLCRARVCRQGEIVCGNYGRLTAAALDPIEKKPLRRFHPGSRILSVGSYGCNLRCPFCQNCDISMADARATTLRVTPEELTDKAVRLREQGNIGLAYTYNEPLIGYEFVRDCARLIHRAGLLNVAVTNGYLCPGPFSALLPDLDALNIDLKGFTDRYYRSLGGDLATVCRSIELAAARCHVEVTTLIVPGENDSDEEMDRLSAFLAAVSPDLPLHVTRFFPRFQMADRPPTPVADVYRLAEIARRRLRYVYTGNC